MDVIWESTMYKCLPDMLLLIMAAMGNRFCMRHGERDRTVIMAAVT